VDSAAKPASQPRALLWLGFTRSSSQRRIAKLPFSIQSVEAAPVLPVPPLGIELRSSYFFFQLDPPVSVLPAPFVSELTREVFLLDQSERILRALQKSRKPFLLVTVWKSVHACARNFFASQNLGVNLFWHSSLCPLRTLC
jgi:hypothetical protein